MSIEIVIALSALAIALITVSSLFFILWRRQSVSTSLSQRVNLERDAKYVVTSKPEDILGPRYKIGYELGRGMNAVTYCVEDTQDKSQPLVAKMLLTPEEEPRITATSFIRHSNRFRREMKHLEELHDSQYVVRLHKSQPYALRPFFVMERCDGSLADRISSGLLDMQEILDVMVDVLLGLQNCHKRKIFHRDLKPANILKRGDKWVLADFGMSLLGNDATVVSVPESLPGTIPYTAPEVMYFDSAQIGPPADLFSLGVTLKEMLTGQNIWHEQPSNLLQYRAGKIRKEEVSHFNAIVDLMISLRPEDRQQNVGETAKLIKAAFMEVNQTRLSEAKKRSYSELKGIDRLDRVVSNSAIQ